MVPYQRPIPGKKSQPGSQSGSQPGMSGLIGSWIQAEKMIQIALVLPCAALIGWLLGAWLDHALHQKWIATAGIIFGIVSGLVGAIQMAVVFSAEPGKGKKNGTDAEKGNSGKTS
jgi:uncharacterized membrane protein YfcA